MSGSTNDRSNAPEDSSERPRRSVPSGTRTERIKERRGGDKRKKGERKDERKRERVRSGERRIEKEDILFLAAPQKPVPPSPLPREPIALAKGFRERKISHMQMIKARARACPVEIEIAGERERKRRRLHLSGALQEKYMTRI